MASRDRLQVIAIYRPALQMAGDRDRGREVFHKTCATCHQAEGRGVDVGPNLATVTNRSGEELLVHILDPNREVAPNYVNYNVATAQGRVISGIITDESARAIVVKACRGSDRRDSKRTDRSGCVDRRVVDAGGSRERAIGQ